MKSHAEQDLTVCRRSREKSQPFKVAIAAGAPICAPHFNNQPGKFPECVKNNLFLHLVVGSNPRWRVGACIKTTKIPNRLWAACERENLVYRIRNSKVVPMDLVLRHALEVYRGKSDRSRDYHYNIVRSCEEAVQCIYFNLRLVRELVFEEVRSRNYPHHPSRRTCIWLLSNKPSSVRTWRKSLPNGVHRLFRVSATGIIHRANPQFLEGGSLGISFWKQMASDYWAGVGSHVRRSEILFEGCLNVIDEVPLK